ncbi:hypothetical protein [Pseudoduganella sp. RAF53_2]|uniref:hypothetical protein n=1 Tax=unclassified Pseudoduganella TaxID=2637179 RepID=UPI003F98553A
MLPLRAQSQLGLLDGEGIMANDGVNEYRIAMLEQQMAEVLVKLDEMRTEYATKAELAALTVRVERLEQEVKEMRIEYAARFAAIEKRLDTIEATLATLATKDELKAAISQALNRGMAVMITTQLALNSGLYLLLRHAN